MANWQRRNLDDVGLRGGAGRARERDRARRRSSSCTGCGCCRAAGTAGPSCSRRPGTPPLAPGWPDDPETVAEANAPPRGVRPQVGRRRSPTTSRTSSAGSTRKPAIIGHSFGGLLTQILAGRGLRGGVGGHRPGAVPGRAAAADLRAAVGVPGAAATRPTATAPCRSPTSSSATRSPTRSTEDEAKELYETYAVPAPGEPLFQAATANLNPWTEVKVEIEEPRARPAADHRRREGPHRAVGDRQRLLQAAEAQRGRHRDRRDPGRGHSLTIDSGWREVADTALAFVSAQREPAEQAPAPRVGAGADGRGGEVLVPSGAARTHPLPGPIEDPLNPDRPR